MTWDSKVYLFFISLVGAGFSFTDPTFNQGLLMALALIPAFFLGVEYEYGKGPRGTDGSRGRPASGADHPAGGGEVRDRAPGSRSGGDRAGAAQTDGSGPGVEALGGAQGLEDGTQIEGEDLLVPTTMDGPVVYIPYGFYEDRSAPERIEKMIHLRQLCYTGRDIVAEELCPNMGGIAIQNMERLDTFLRDVAALEREPHARPTSQEDP